MHFAEMKSMSTAPDEDQPKRPLSAYNIFFQVERQRLISDTPKTGSFSRAEVYSICLDKATRIEKSKRPHRKMHGVISFTDLAKTIAQKWKGLDNPDKRLFEERAENEKRKYAIELEEWLLRQVPTQQVKKRLSALRRGSLSKFIPAREHSPSPTPAPVFTTPSSAHIISQDPSPSSPRRVVMMPSMDSSHYMVTPANARRPHPTPPSRRQIQLQRARNLERLYQMQVQLYNEQMRLHAEVNGDLEASFDDPPQTFYQESSPKTPHPTVAARVVSSDSLAWPPQYSNLPGYGEESAAASAYACSPFHEPDGRVSPFGGGNDLFLQGGSY